MCIYKKNRSDQISQYTQAIFESKKKKTATVTVRKLPIPNTVIKAWFIINASFFKFN